jgi:putative transposase
MNGACVFDKPRKCCYNEAVKTFKFRLYPTKAQCRAMTQSLDACRWVYNKTLEVRRDAWRERQESLSLYDTQKLLTQWKQEEPWLAMAYSQSLQNAQARVDLAFNAFFRRVRIGEKPGYPRFHGADRYNSFTYPQSGFKLGERLYLSKVGQVKIRLHRPIEGKVKTLAIRRDALGNWWACFSCEVEPEPLPPTTNIVGIDLGLEKFATLSTGKTIDNPRFFRKDEKALAKAQRHLSKCEKGTPEYAKVQRVIQHIHQRIANRRKNFAHQQSRELVNEFQFIAFEDLSISNMLKNHCLAKSISDAAWNQLVQYTVYKAEDAGRSVVLVDPRNTSKICSQCGSIVEKDLSVRTYSCPNCGLEIDRDLNASLNILARGLASVGSIPRSSPL